MTAEPYRPASARTLRLELVLLLAVTFGCAALTAVLSLADAVLRDLSAQTVPLNPQRSRFGWIDLGLNVVVVAQLAAWGGLALYLLWRGGLSPSRVGLGRPRWRPDLLGGLGLAAVIGLPGLALYVGARAVGLNATVVPSGLDDTWWRLPMLTAIAVANGWAEEVVVVGYLLTRLRQLGLRAPAALALSSLLRGGYHLYQGFGAGLGNVVMGAVFGYAWQRSGRLWPLVLAHALIDTVAFAGWAVLADRLSWLGA